MAAVVLTTAGWDICARADWGATLVLAPVEVARRTPALLWGPLIVDVAFYLREWRACLQAAISQSARDLLVEATACDYSLPSHYCYQPTARRVDRCRHVPAASTWG